MILEGKSWMFGENIDTDAIIAARYLNTHDADQLAAHLMEDIRPGFSSRIEPGDIIVAGSNFGCGSSREHAPLAIKGAGVSCVIATSFARIFYRNAVNIGLPILECPDPLYTLLQEGTLLRVDLEKGLIRASESDPVYQAALFPTFMQEIIRQGGLVEYVQERLRRGA